MKQKYAVYRNRTVVTDYRTKKLAIYKSLRKSNEYRDIMNLADAGYYVAVYIEPVKAKGIK